MDGKTSRDFLEFMLAGAISKTVASCIAYPHEVARTRLREEGSKYNTFWQTLHTVWKEEGRAGLYRLVFFLLLSVLSLSFSLLRNRRNAEKFLEKKVHVNRACSPHYLFSLLF